MLQKGNFVPDISLRNQEGQMVSLRAFRKPLVIYFYPKNNTRVCTAQACGFSDEYSEINRLGAEVIGISTDSVSSHKKVVDKRKLPFILLSDIDKVASRAFKIPTMLFGLLPARVTFISDAEGKIIQTYRSDFSATDHVNVAVKALAQIN